MNWLEGKKNGVSYLLAVIEQDTPCRSLAISPSFTKEKKKVINYVGFSIREKCILPIISWVIWSGLR